jgi:hypothetical protein
MRHNFKNVFLLVIFPLTAACIFFLPDYGKAVSVMIFLAINMVFLIGVVIDTSRAKKKVESK